MEEQCCRLHLSAGEREDVPGAADREDGEHDEDMKGMEMERLQVREGREKMGQDRESGGYARREESGKEGEQGTVRGRG